MSWQLSKCDLAEAHRALFSAPYHDAERNGGCRFTGHAAYGASRCG
jgi:hypothetical protein